MKNNSKMIENLTISLTLTLMPALMLHSDSICCIHSFNEKFYLAYQDIVDTEAAITAEATRDCPDVVLSSEDSALAVYRKRLFMNESAKQELYNQLHNERTALYNNLICIQTEATSILTIAAQEALEIFKTNPSGAVAKLNEALSRLNEDVNFLRGKRNNVEECNYDYEHKQDAELCDEIISSYNSVVKLVRLAKITAKLVERKKNDILAVCDDQVREYKINAIKKNFLEILGEYQRFEDLSENSPFY